MLSKLSVRRPYTVVVAVIIVLILGAISFLNLKTDLLPSIDLPYLMIMTNYPGASPEEVEMLVTRPIEQSVATVNNIKNISSISQEHTSIVILEFNADTNMDSAIIEINGMLDLVKPAWDDYNISSPMTMKLNPDMLPIMISAVDVKDMDIVEISQMVSEKIIPELESVNGVASVTGVGLLEESIEVEIDPHKIEELNRKILSSIDSDLAKAEVQLEDARKEIEDGKAQLAFEEKKHMDELNQGETALKAAKEQIAQGEKQILAGKKELDKQKGELEKGLKEITQKEEELKKSEETLLALGDNLTEEDKMNLAAIQAGLKEISRKKAEASMGLETISSKLAELEVEEKGLQEKKSQLVKQEEEISLGKSQLKAEMDKARAQLRDGETTLNEKISEFEQARKEAFKEAALDDVISTDMISGILAAQNFSMPSGYVNNGDGDRQLVKVGDKIRDISEMENLLLFDTGENAIGKVYLKDVANIKMKNNAEDVYAKVNGNDAVILNIQKQSTFLTSEVSKNLRDKMDELAAEDENVSFTNLMDQGMYIDIVVDSVLKNIIFGGILAIVVLIVFLRDIKPTFIIAVSIPISIIFAIAMMYFTGVTINVISLAGLALGVGMLVDNSIVAIENIYRLRSEGKSAKEAAVEGAAEIAGAITSSTLTTACVFLPIVFVEGISRQLFTDMGLTIAYSLFASLIVALTLVPTMASGMLKKIETKEQKTFGRLINWYEKVLKLALGHRLIVMVLVAAVFVLSIFAGLSSGSVLFPDMDAPQMSMSIEIDEGSSPKDLEAVVDEVFDRLLTIDEIETIGAFKGGGIMGLDAGGESDSLSLYLLLDEDKTISNIEIEKKIQELTEDLNATITVDTNTMDMSALIGSGLEVVIKGNELETLNSISSDIKDILSKIDGVREVTDGNDEDLTEIRITVDKEKAMAKGLTVAQVFADLNSKIGNQGSSTIVTIENKDYPVIIIDKRHGDIRKENIGDIKIKSEQSEEEVEIKDIAIIEEVQGTTAIRRDSQERYMSVNASLDTGYNVGLVSREFERKLNDYKLPDGYTIELAGESEMIEESFTDLFKMILLAVVLIYLIMVAQFQSLLSPFIILFTIPLAFTGGLLGLYITGHEMSIIALLGFLVLGGIVVNNGIVFVDYTNQLRDTGRNKTDALIEAGKTRMRPIMMTAITTIFGLLTLAIGVGTGAEMLQPLAIVSIGGLVYSTILTLFVVPVMYHLLNKDTVKKA